MASFEITEQFNSPLTPVISTQTPAEVRVMSLMPTCSLCRRPLNCRSGDEECGRCCRHNRAVVTGGSELVSMVMPEAPFRLVRLSGEEFMMAKTKPCWPSVKGPLAQYADGFRAELARLGYTHPADCGGSADRLGRRRQHHHTTLTDLATAVRWDTYPAATAQRPRATARPDRPALGGGLVRPGRPRCRRQRGTGRARRTAAAGRRPGRLAHATTRSTRPDRSE